MYNHTDIIYFKILLDKQDITQKKNTLFGTFDTKFELIMRKNKENL